MCNTTIHLRNYKPNDLEEIADLFYNTVHTIASKDYSKNQVNAWATGQIDKEEWNKTLRENYTVIAESDGKIVGFGDLAENYLNRLFVHAKYQGNGIASAITNELETYAKSKGINIIKVHASLTAKPFFEHRGYKVIKEQEVERNGVLLTNFVMKVNLSL